MERCAESSMVLVFAWCCTCMYPLHRYLAWFMCCSWTSLLACAPCSSCSSSCHVSSMYLYLQLLMMRRHQIPKSPSLPWCTIFHFRLQVTDREDKALEIQRAHFRLGCGLGGTVKKNCVDWQAGMSSLGQQWNFVGSGSVWRQYYEIF